jgi:hypothetical protein
LKNRGVYVGGAAHGPSVYKLGGHVIDRFVHLTSQRSVGGSLLHTGEGLNRHACRAPGSKLSGGEILASDFLDVCIHVVGRYLPTTSIVANVLEEMLAG